MKKHASIVLMFTLGIFVAFNGGLAYADSFLELPDFLVSEVSIKYKDGANPGYYLYATIENRGEAYAGANFLSVELKGLDAIGLPDGYILYLVNDKKEGVYSYMKGYKKEYIGPSVELLKSNTLNVVATVDPANYFGESNEVNNSFSKVVTKSNSLIDARIIFESGKTLTVILENSGAKKNVAAQKTSMKKNVDPVIKGSKLSDIQKYAMNNFIVYGTKNTNKLTQAKRVEMIKKFKAQYKKNPTTVGDWQRVLEIKESYGAAK